MSDQIKQIAERLQGLRDVLELTPDEVAKSCQLFSGRVFGYGKRGERYFCQCFTENSP